MKQSKYQFQSIYGISFRGRTFARVKLPVIFKRSGLEHGNAYGLSIG